MEISDIYELFYIKITIKIIFYLSIFSLNYNKTSTIFKVVE